MLYLPNPTLKTYNTIQLSEKIMNLLEFHIRNDFFHSAQTFAQTKSEYRTLQAQQLSKFFNPQLSSTTPPICRSFISSLSPSVHHISPPCSLHSLRPPSPCSPPLLLPTLHPCPGLTTAGTSHEVSAQLSSGHVVPIFQ